MEQATNAPTIDEGLVRQLIAGQFPQWTDMPIRRVQPGGWDNVTFRLGNRLLVRLPRSEEYAPQVEKEYAWLPKLAPSLPLRIPEPLAVGSPTDRYPWRWSVTTWIDGEAATRERVCDLEELATILGEFLSALERIDATGGPLPGAHNFHRGGPLRVYDAEARRAFELLSDHVDAQRAHDLRSAALHTTGSPRAVWLHGDISPGNLLVNNGRLSAVIDFGNVGVGDPACDLAIAWSFLEERSRESFRKAICVDDDTWCRGRAWALWKAVIVSAGLVQTNAIEMAHCRRTIDEVLSGA